MTSKLFKKIPWGKNKQEKQTNGPQSAVPDSVGEAGSDQGTANGMQDRPSAPAKPSLMFHCQLAHGSPTGIISGFTNVKELYEKIADCFTESSIPNFDASQILFCTLNTHKVDMAHLLGGQIGLEDFIFAHCKGRPKKVDITKNDEALGLTITDNGAGYAFIKRIKQGSVMDQFEGLCVGDHIEKIDDVSLVGCRHFEVAKMLKEIPKGSTFTMRLVEPAKSGFNNIDIRGASGSKKSVTDGNKTIRLNKKGTVQVEEVDGTATIAIDKINGLLESFMGINDADLSQSIWEMGSQKDNPSDFAIAIDESELGSFGFADDLVFDLWGAILDAKQGRLQKTMEFNETF